MSDYLGAIFRETSGPIGLRVLATALGAIALSSPCAVGSADTEEGVETASDSYSADDGKSLQSIAGNDEALLTCSQQQLYCK